MHRFALTPFVRSAAIFSFGLAALLALAGLAGCDDTRGSCTEPLPGECACGDEGRVGTPCADGTCACPPPSADAGTGASDGAAPPDDGAIETDGSTLGGDAAVATTCTGAGVLRCGADGVERCDGASWTLVQPCPAGCADGACDDAAIACTPDATRCFRSSVQRCNREGTAWLFDSVCGDACDGGACVGACTPGEARCDGPTRQTCLPDGSGFGADEACALGCDRRVCVEAELLNEGVTHELRGDHVYDGCVRITLGGTLRIPAGERVEVWTRCLEVTSSSRIELGAAASFVLHARETVTLEGAAAGGDELVLEALDTLTLTGSVASARAVLRGDALTIGATGTTTGSPQAYALYGRAFVRDGAHSGVVSVMPPAPLDSPTYPRSGVWNVNADDLVVAWDRPFPSVVGYYVAVGGELPGPGVGEYRTEEFVVLSADMLRPGTNVIRVVAVNADSEVGTHAEDLTLRINVSPPTITSSSHPASLAWGGPDDVYLSWVDPLDVADEALVGYWYAFDRMADTVPGPAHTFDDRDSLLLADRDPGVWMFHLVNVDRMGRASPRVARYAVRVGPEPGLGNVAGTITDAATGAPIPGATVVLDGGAEWASTATSGDYTFRGEVPSRAEPYRLRVRAYGYGEVTRDLVIGPGASIVEHVALSASATPPGDRVELSWAFRVGATWNAPDLEVSPLGRLIWSSSGVMGIADLLGTTAHTEALTGGVDLGAHSGAFHGVGERRCARPPSFEPGTDRYCLEMRAWGHDGTPLATPRRWGDYESMWPVAVWNGSTYGVFFVSARETLAFRELTADLAFANGGAEAANTPLAFVPGYRPRAPPAAVWDGDGYGVAWRVGGDAGARVMAARWTRTGAVLLAPVVIDSTLWGHDAVEITDDGARAHITYHRYDSVRSRYELVLRSIARDGTVSAPVVLTEMEGERTASLAFDGRFLYVAYDREGGAVLELRDPSDHRVVQTVELGAVSVRRVSVGPGMAQGALLVADPYATGIFVQPFTVR